MPLFENGVLRTHREIAQRMGIGRARVFYHEQAAMRKVRSALLSQGIVDWGSARNFEILSRPVFRAPKALAASKFSELHGWLVVSRILPMNGCSVAVDEILEAFKCMQFVSPKEYFPICYERSQAGLVPIYRVQALFKDADKLRVRLWPLGGGPRSVAHLSSTQLIAVVESESGADAEGEFDIPILTAVIVIST